MIAGTLDGHSIGNRPGSAGYVSLRQPEAELDEAKVLPQCAPRRTLSSFPPGSMRVHKGRCPAEPGQFGLMLYCLVPVSSGITGTSNGRKHLHDIDHQPRGQPGGSAGLRVPPLGEGYRVRGATRWHAVVACATRRRPRRLAHSRPGGAGRTGGDRAGPSHPASRLLRRGAVQRRHRRHLPLAPGPRRRGAPGRRTEAERRRPRPHARDQRSDAQGRGQAQRPVRQPQPRVPLRAVRTDRQRAPDPLPAPPLGRGGALPERDGVRAGAAVDPAGPPQARS